jgi:hypothetical protein
MLKYLPSLTLMGPILCFAESPFAGTWVVQPELTTFDLRPLSLVVDRGIFKRTSCTSADEVPADGVLHGVAGDPWADMMSVSLVDKNRVDVLQTVAGKLTWKGQYTIAKDGRSMQLRFEDHRPEREVDGIIQLERDGEPMLGAHLLQGTWEPRKLLEVSATAASMTIQDTDNGLLMRASDGRAFDIKFDQKPHPLSGYLDGATVQVGRRSPKTLQVNRRQQGTYVELAIGQVSEDGQTMVFGQVDWQCQSRISWTLHKQPAA